ncbi:hypothetical protein BGZ95_003445 [Linnemannia exigua]|uniref:3CxxC-type domain-containing protein n=1 Tax=Linnemannia exigua TaxID=604196 RepID=A0AAD4DJM7_9FUNG|nr:hypothetical protein BGZ95_003445 [Linnemannia exigua]
MARSKKPKVEIDAGGKYHAALSNAEGGDRYEYDPKLTAQGCRRYGVKNMSGLFTCYACRPNKPHSWGSGIICTELYLSAINTYRVVFNAQMCKLCNRYARPKVDIDRYVAKVVDTFALWTGQRKAHAGNGPHKSTGPHDSSRCRGCLKGICTMSDANKNKSKSKKR